jgi:GT2 family glycosyltransferase/4-hydroxybenzoate polyprenyltransferase
VRERFDVTVIVPTYEGARYLPECLDAIAAQDLRGVEVLVVDDRSTDDTVAIARSYADRIDHLRVEVNTERLGAVANVNRCIELAQGRWIKPVFQDDLIDPGCLAAMRTARVRRVPLVVAARRYKFEGGVPEWQRNACEHLLEASLWRRFGGGVLAGDRVAEVAAETVANRVPQLNFLGEPVAILLDKRAVQRAGGFDTGYVQIWDYELPLRLAVQRGVVLVDEPLTSFRVHGGSETARNLSGSAFGINVIDRLRLQVAYATDRAYAPVRAAAARRVEPMDVTVVAIGVAAAAQRIAEELPEAERASFRAPLDALVARLPAEVPDRAPSPWDARNAEIAMLLELSARDLPAHLVDPPEPAVSEVVVSEVVVSEPGAPVPGSVEPLEPPVVESAVAAGPPVSGSSWHKVRRVADALRTNQWWGHMLGPIVAFAALQIGWRQVPPGDGLPRVVALVVSAVALAGYGYVVNDAADVEPDRLAGKANAMARFSVPMRLGVIAAFALAGALPWLVYPLEAPALVALGAIYLIPLLYSVPPVRLKERHLFGPLADASNAFVAPALFTVALFAPLGEAAGPAPLMVVGAVLWPLGFGMRAILKHQVDDAEHDQVSGTVTLVTKLGAARVQALGERVVFPIELTGLALLAATVLWWSWIAVALALAAFVAFQALRVTGVVDRRTAMTTLALGYWMYWYQIWPALVLSVALAVQDPWYLLLVAFVVVLFWFRVRSGFEVFGRTVMGEYGRHRARWRSRVSG